MADSTAALETSGTTSKDIDVNPRGIPKAAFIVSLVLPPEPALLLSHNSIQQANAAAQSILQESVEEFLGGPDLEAEPELAKLNEMLAYVPNPDSRYSSSRQTD